MFSNTFILVPLIAWAVAQTLKFVWQSYRGRIDFRYLYLSGGMPSAHTAAVVALAVNAYFQVGGSSHLFGLSAVLAAIIIYDSFGVRRSVGDQSQALNALLDGLAANRVNVGEIKRLREVLGHTPAEVIVGGLIGTIVALLFNIEKIMAPIGWLTTMATKTEYIAYAGAGLAVVLGGWLARWQLGRGQRGGSRAFRQLRKAVFIKSQVVGWSGLVLAGVEYETRTFMSWRLWPVLLGLIWLTWVLVLWQNWQKRLPRLLGEEAEQQRKAKWLYTGRKKR